MSKAGKTMAAGAVLLVGGLLAALAGTMLALIDAFASPTKATVTVQELAAEISDSMAATIIGLPIAAVGFGLLIGGLVAYLIGRGRATDSPGVAQES